MIKNVLKFLIAFAFLSLMGILLMDYLLLPSYVGYNKEHYLPDIRGEFVEKANYQLRSLGFQTEVVMIPFSETHEAGTVIKMYPRAFTKVKEGRTIDLTIAGKDEDIEIPDISNLSLRNAKLTLTKLGLGIDTIIYEYDNVISDGYISFQLPRKGQTVKSSTNMTLGVSRGAPPDYYIIPDIVNYSLTRARKSIINEGLRVGEITYEFQPDLVPNTVIEQNMTAGMRVSFPASINLLISTDKQEN